MTTTFYPSLNSLGVIPVSRLKNFEKNEGLGKFCDSAICQTGRSLYFSCSFSWSAARTSRVTYTPVFPPMSLRTITVATSSTVVVNTRVIYKLES